MAKINLNRQITLKSTNVLIFPLSLIYHKLLASGQLKDQIPGVPKCEDGEEESEKEQSQNIYKDGGFHLMGIGADGHGGARAVL